MTKTKTTTTATTKKPRKPAKPKPKSARQQYFDAVIADAPARAAARQETIARQLAGWPSATEWEGYKVSHHGAVVHREYTLFDHMLIVTCSDGTTHKRTVSRSDRGEVRADGFHDDGYSSSLAGHARHYR